MADLNKTLIQINGALGTINAILPAALAAYTTLHALWKKANPEKPFEAFNDELLNGSIDVQQSAAAWLHDHGYTQNADGSWTKTH